MTETLRSMIAAARGKVSEVPRSPSIARAMKPRECCSHRCRPAN
jgi:hypothetical protein